MQLLDCTFRQFATSACILLLLACAIAAPAGAVTLGISKDGRYFTLNGRPTYLNGISYYSGTAADDPNDLKLDLDDMVKYHFNWIRVWTHWSGEESVTGAKGEIREPYMSRLKTIITECNKRGMIVDVTMHRGKNPNPSNQAEHLACARTIATELKPYRNVYIDVGNERDVGDARHVPIEEVGELISEIKKIDPKRICTASATPGSQKDIEDFLKIGKQDFIAPHLCRDDGCSAKTLGTVTEMIGWMKALGRRAPIHLQEPFRRGYTDYQPKADDYYRDDSGGKLAGAAGWCLHNGSDRGRTEPRRGRSFELGKGHGRLFAQLDDVELEVCKNIDAKIGGTDVKVLRYHGEVQEQILHRVPDKRHPGIITNVKPGSFGQNPDVPAGKHKITWILRPNNPVSVDGAFVELQIDGGGKQLLASKHIKYRDFKDGIVTVPFTTEAAGPVKFGLYYGGPWTVVADEVTFEIDGGK